MSIFLSAIKHNVNQFQDPNQFRWSLLKYVDPNESQLGLGVQGDTSSTTEYFGIIKYGHDLDDIK